MYTKSKYLFISLLLTTSLLTACKDEVNVAEEISKITITQDMYLDDITIKNADIIAKALNKGLDNNKVIYIAKCMDIINTGIIQTVWFEESSNEEKIIVIKSVDNIFYKIYLSRSGDIAGIKESNAEEWIYQAIE